MAMHSARRALFSAAALLFVAGCAGSSSSLAPGARALTPQSSGGTMAGYRLIPGPAVAGPILVPIAHANGPGYLHVGPDVKKLLYVADANNKVVQIYNPDVPNPSPIGMITSGVGTPFGLAVDKKGTLYVVDIVGATVSEYKAGQTTPFFTINSGMSSPYGIAVDRHFNVFVTNLGTNTVSAYHRRQATPYETVSGVGPNPVGIAADSKNDVYVADDSDNTIYVIPAGSSTAHNSGITQLNGPIGVAFGRADTLFVANFAINQVAIYPAGSTTPSGTITTGINQPTLNGFARPYSFFQSDQTGPVEGYLKGQTSPFSTISGIGRPTGIASSPRLQP